MGKESMEKIERKEKEPMPSMKVLLVEDRPEYQEVAKKALESIDPERKVTLETAKDYEEFEKLIKESEEKKEKFDAAITDLLFPKKTGSNDRNLGIEITKKIREKIESPEAQEDKDYRLNEDCVIQDLNDLEKAVKGEVYEQRFTWLSPLEKEVKKEGRCIETGRVKPTESDQPLGILVVERAKELGLPYVVATSGHGAHGDLTTPIVFYLKLKGLLPDYRGTSAEEELRTEKEAIRELQVKDPKKSKEELIEWYRKCYEGNPLFTDIDKSKPEIWKNILRRTSFYVEQTRKAEREK